MKFFSNKDFERRVSIALFCTLVVSVWLIIAWLGSEKQNLESSADSSIVEYTNVPEENMVQSISNFPDKYTLNQSLPDLVFVKADGKKLRLNNLRGKIVVLTFWASWCPYCQEELKRAGEIKNILSEHKDVEYLLVDRLESGKETKKQALDYLKKNNIPFTTVFDENRKAYNKLGIKLMPTTLIINKNGVLKGINIGGDLNANKLKSKIQYVKSGASTGVFKFIKEKLRNDEGGIRVNYLQENNSELKSTDVLSESQGLIMEYALSTKDKKLFDMSLNYILKNMKKDPLTAWIYTEKGASRINSSVDDLRLYRVLATADELWEEYSSLLAEYEEALFLYNTDKQMLINQYDFKYKDKSNQLKLCFADLEALSLLMNANSRWENVYENCLSIIEQGYIDDNFPLYYPVYDHGAERYVDEEINMAEGMLTLLHLAKEKRLKAITIKWLKKAIEGNGIFARYKINGAVAKGYEYESTAVYGLVSLIGNEIKDKDLQNRALMRMEGMRIFNAGSSVEGAFGNLDGTGIYSFDQCIALLAYSKAE